MTTQQIPKTLSRSSDFPPDFLWGVATAAYQVEGAWDEGGRGPSIWDTFSQTPGNTLNGETGNEAVDHYHRYVEDVAIMRDLGVNAYRFSLSWSRLIPDGTGEINPDGVAFYRNLATELISNGITPAVTLYHWDLPQALQDRGGWLNPESVEWFAQYASVAKEQLGDLIGIWTTLNEPWCTAFLGHSAGEHAPGGKNAADAFVVAHHLMLAHHAAIRAMRATSPRPDDQLGIVLNLIPAWPADESAEAAEAARGVDAIQNRLFLHAVMDGEYPEEVLEYHARHDLEDRIDVAELAKTVEPIDLLGINYYNINHIAYEPGADPMPAWPGPYNATFARPPGELTQMDWGVEPEGLTWMLKTVGGRYPEMPLMIMENGAAYPDVVEESGEINDVKRTEYVRLHIGAIHEAREAGVNVVGYFLWSLLDNFEWARGYSKLFGIVHVDRSTMKRTVKASGRWYRAFLAS
ncbi:MAG TPA: GH1 family beta-glucosidase [Acidimicrobiia bacterium]|nr:GH1 family beta-glucosidase [Acidimicrobiia bacterium]